MNCLIVEDDACLAYALSCCLEDCGNECQVSGSVQEALACLKTRKFDLLVLDYALPDGSVLPVSEYAALFCPDVRIILLTGHAVFAHGEHATMAPGIDWVMRKPVPFDDLRALVEYARLDVCRNALNEPACT